MKKTATKKKYFYLNCVKLPWDEGGLIHLTHCDATLIHLWYTMMQHWLCWYILLHYDATLIYLWHHNATFILIYLWSYFAACVSNNTYRRCEKNTLVRMHLRSWIWNCQLIGYHLVQGKLVLSHYSTCCLQISVDWQQKSSFKVIMVIMYMVIMYNVILNKPHQRPSNN